MATTYRRVRSTRLLVLGLLVASLVAITVDARGGRDGPMATLGRGLGAVMGPLQEGVAAVVNSLRRENAELRRLFGLSERHGFTLMGATVTAEAPGNFEWAVIIDKGAVDGVTVDMPVINADGLVGRVVDVYPGSAKVMLILDPDSAVSVRLSASGDRGVLQGQREEPLVFRLIDAETEVQPGEAVETSGYSLEEGLGGGYPPSIQVGVVDSVEPDPSNLTLEVRVRPRVDLSRLSTVGVITGQKPLPPPEDADST